MESKDYNLSLDVANFLSMALSSDTHTLAHFHEEDQPLLINLLEFLVVVASVLHTIFH